MEIIVQRLIDDDEFLAIILTTSYFTWQQKYLQILVQLGNLLIPKKKPWEIRDIILLVKDKLSKVHLVAALMNHSENPGINRYMLNEKELFELNKFISQPEGDFISDLYKSTSKLSDEIKERIYKFIFLLDPEVKFEKELDIEPSLTKVKTILHNVGVDVKFDTEPLKPILKSINDYMNSHVKFVNFDSRKSYATVEEVVDTPLLITEK
jgi:hypothetical protein